MASRLATDTCLLCKNAQADKTDSHIVTKSMLKQMFRPKSGAPVRGYLVGSHTPKRSTIVQDSAKESYILCTRCEGRFEKIETYIANKFLNRFRNPAFQKEFPITSRGYLIPAEMDLMTLSEVDRGMMRLFVYSIFWRASVASVAGYRLFKLPEQVEEQLRAEIDSILGDGLPETLSHCEQYSLQEPVYPYHMLTSSLKTDNTRNFAGSFDLEDGRAMIMANEFMLTLYLDGQIGPNAVGFNVNTKRPEVSLCSPGQWAEYMTRMAEIMGRARLRAMGKDA